MLKIGILSDTHKKVGRAQKAIDRLLAMGAQYLIHAGDIGKEEVLAYMEATGLPYTAVLGNNDRKLVPLVDRYHLVKEPHYFRIEGLRIKLMHHPWFLSPDADLVIFGHTHKFSADCREDGSLFLNPGEVCARNKPVSEMVLLEATPHRWRILHCQRGIKESAWHTNEKECEREA